MIDSVAKMTILFLENRIQRYKFLIKILCVTNVEILFNQNLTFTVKFVRKLLTWK